MGFKLGKRKAAGSIVLNAMTIVITLLIIISSLYFVRDKMLKNAQSLGTALTQSYATEQQAQMRMFEDYLDIGSQYVNELIRSGADDKEIQNWMVDYFKKITKLYGDKVIDPYAVIGGKSSLLPLGKGMILMSIKIQSGIRWLWLIKERSFLQILMKMR